MALPLPDFGLIAGETVVVERRVLSGVDPGNDPVYTWVSESVDYVCVAPGPRSDLVESNRPNGTIIAWNLHFPKGYPATLEGARVRVRGQEPCDVVGDPQHLTEANTPGPWSLIVELTARKG